MSRNDTGEKVALVLPSVMASGTERRLSFVYRHLERRFPGRYRLLLSRELYGILNRGGFGLDRLPGVRVLGRRSRFDRKAEAHAPPLVDLGRLITLEGYRREVRQLVRAESISLVHPYLELVPFLALRPLRDVRWIAAVVDHLPKYFDGRSRDSRLLLRAISLSWRTDCLYPPLRENLVRLGVDPSRLNCPAWNCVNHEAFHPEEKESDVSYAARTIDWKNPMLMIDVIDYVLRHRPATRFSVIGRGKLQSALGRAIELRGWQGQVRIGYFEDPSPIVNRSRIHVSLDQYDNLSNQSLLEGMASGCAVVASDVGGTHRVVTDEVGIRTSLAPEAIGEAILALLADPARAQEMGRRGRERVLENHHVDRYIDYLRLLHDPATAVPILEGVARPPDRAVGSRAARGER